jgi:KUP system potassium uptake protein
MVITTILFFVVARARWQWGLAVALPVVGFFLIIDLAFFGANILKIPHGGWFPLVVAAVAFTLMTTWKRGRWILAERMADSVLPIDVFLQDIAKRRPVAVPGTAVFMYSNPNATPPALLHNLKHNKVLHERVLFLSVQTDQVPHVQASQRVALKDLGNGFYQVLLHYGFMDEPHIPAALSGLKEHGLDLKPLETTYFLGRETIIPSRRGGMALWRDQVFAVLARNARSPTSFYQLPPNRVVELGAQIRL